jgi:phosphoribosylanthranilate isomerase
LEDALAASGSGADAIGFIFYQKSKRYVQPETAANIISQLPPFVTTVGVFVNHSVNEIMEITKQSGITLAQLHGDETPQFCSSLPLKSIKVIRVKDASDIDKVAQYPDQYILFDTHSDVEYGGTGIRFDWNLIDRQLLKNRIILSGGLSPDNVLEAVRAVGPYAVDVSSGVESRPGKKDRGKIKAFIEAIKHGD